MADSPSYDDASRGAGGRARAARLTSEERSRIAKKAASKRWEVVPEAVCGSADKPLVLGDVAIECYVLEDGTRVLSQSSFLRALGRSRTSRRIDGATDMPPMIQGKALKPFLSDQLLEHSRSIPFKLPSGQKALGYHAELLPDVCEAFLAARRAGELPANQQHIALQAEILMAGLARVGIIALVDEATGYQEMRTRDALAHILSEFIDKELQPYLTTFQPDFYREMFRLRGLRYSAESVKRPQYFGKLTNDIVYARLAPGVLEELKRTQERNESGRPKHKLFQRLTQNVGYPKLREHLGSVTTIMKLSTDWDDFSDKLDEIHPKIDTDQALPGMRRRELRS
jgi:hypothetical protein